MDKSTIFISSTIYDFSDLRSAMKYWLDEMGFDTQLSEYNDFVKDTTQNSYDACLEAVRQSDYFVLLIGSRRGGMYPNEDISITRKEYRTAYELAKQGKIKKIIILIRQNVWDVKEDRKALKKLLDHLRIVENDKEIDKKVIEYYDSNILKDAEHIVSFINEVTRNKEARDNEKPVMNWVHTFSTFEDVIKVLKAELGIRFNMSVSLAEQNVRSILLYNMQCITASENDKVVGYYLGFTKIRTKLIQSRKSYSPLELASNVHLTTNELGETADFFLFFRNGIKDLDTSVLENILSSGIFLRYSNEQECFVQTDFNRALTQIIREIKRLKQFETDFTFTMQEKLLNQIKGFQNYPDKIWEFDFFSLAMLNGIYERLVNIQNLVSFMLQHINTHNEHLEYPKMLNGLIDSNKPTEEMLEKIFS